MLLKCLNDYQFERYGRLWKCEETEKYGDIYEVDDDLGKELLATGDFADVAPGVAPDKLEAAKAELSKSYGIVSIAAPVGDEPSQPVASSRTRKKAAEPEPGSEPEPKPAGEG